MLVYTVSVNIYYFNYEINNKKNRLHVKYESYTNENLD